MSCLALASTRNIRSRHTFKLKRGILKLLLELRGDKGCQVWLHHELLDRDQGNLRLLITRRTSHSNVGIKETLGHYNYNINSNQVLDS